MAYKLNSIVYTKEWDSETKTTEVLLGILNMVN